jgi:uncharacterized membrane protein
LILEEAMKVEEHVLIHRPPQEVFAYLAVRSHDTIWMASVVESAWLDADAPDAAEPISVGRRGRMVLKVPGRRAVFVDEVTEYDPGRRIAHRTIEGPLPLRTACLCNPADDGGCRTTVVGEIDHLPGGVFGRLVAPVFATMIRRGFRADLARLKTILENEVRSQGVVTP